MVQEFTSSTAFKTMRNQAKLFSIWRLNAAERENSVLKDQVMKNTHTFCQFIIVVLGSFLLSSNGIFGTLFNDWIQNWKPAVTGKIYKLQSFLFYSQLMCPTLCLYARWRSFGHFLLYFCYQSYFINLKNLLQTMRKSIML